MKLFVIVNSVEGRVDSVFLEKNSRQASTLAIELANEQCDTPYGDIRAAIEKDKAFESSTGDIIVTLHEFSLPEGKKPKKKVRK